MAVTVGSVPQAVPAWRASPAVRQTRKVALLGSHSASLVHCPWLDPTWELWGHGSSVAWYRRPLDRYFDLHGRERWEMNAKKKGKYVSWLKNNVVPIYMQEKYPEIPASIRYPKERILMEYGGIRRYFTNHVAWMIALAFSEGVTTLGLFGINYGARSEWELQRGCAEYWLGRAEERGVHVILPDECTLLSQPKGLYGYESHDQTGTLVQEYRSSAPDLPAPVCKLPAIPPPEMAEEIAIDEAARPEWAKQWKELMMQPTPEQAALGARAANGETHG